MNDETKDAIELWRETQLNALWAELRELREIAKRNVADAQHLRQSAIALETERDALRAQVAAARAVLEIRSEGWAQDALRAMDEAKNE